MTEAEWLACADPGPMLKFLRGKVSDRKMRLFAVACCRNIRHCFTDARSTDALEVAERFADGMATDEERRAAETVARAATADLYPSHRDWAALTIANAASEDTSAAMKAVATAITAAEAAEVDDSIKESRWSAERFWQANILREIVGPLPFRSIPFNPSWISWNDGTIPKLAQAIYEDRAFDRLPVLADALEEAGCTNQNILDHCRSRGEHVRGCWVVDRLLGKS